MSRIQRLPEEVVNKIAAGEVVVRPANAVKELLENSLDAGATEVTVTILDGGLSMLQVQDNGKGISKDDMEIVCERFTTSKLRSFDDLQNMQTFGFRGEALCSLSHVAHVTITTKQITSTCAVQGRYEDGKLVDSLRTSAGLPGTTVSVEDLFYNCKSRKTAFRNGAEESARIIDVVTKYAVHRPDVIFALRKGGSADFRTSGKGDRNEVVSSLLGKDIGKDLLEDSVQDKNLHFSFHTLFSTPISARTSVAIQSKKVKGKSFFLFINDRIVQCSPLKSAIDRVLTLRQLISSFVYISLKIEPSRIDVNVHPTKQTVLFLEQDAIIERIAEFFDTRLDSVMEEQLEAIPPSYLSQKTLSQTLLFHQPSISVLDLSNLKDRDSSEKEKEKKRRDHELIRTSASDRRIHEFLTTKENPGVQSQVETISVTASVLDDVNVEKLGTQSFRVFRFDSLANIRRNICENSSPSLRTSLKKSSYVGAVDLDRILLQVDTHLLSAHLPTLCHELFYQTLIFSFGNLGSFKLGDCGAPVDELFKIASPETEEKVVEQVCDFLESNSSMLDDYFSILFEKKDGRLYLSCIPSLLHGLIPQLESLPSFISQLVKEVDWEEEESCFEGIARCVATLFTPKTEYTVDELYSSMGNAHWRSVVQDILVPRLKSHLLPRKEWEDSDEIQSLATLHQLYKVFERC